MQRSKANEAGGLRTRAKALVERGARCWAICGRAGRGEGGAKWVGSRGSARHVSAGRVCRKFVNEKARKQRSLSASGHRSSATGKRARLGGLS